MCKCSNVLGKYQLETSEGFSDFMSEIGVNWFTRQVASNLFSSHCHSAPDCLCALSDGDEQELGREQSGDWHLVHLQVDLHRVWVWRTLPWDNRGWNWSEDNGHLEWGQSDQRPGAKRSVLNFQFFLIHHSLINHQQRMVDSTLSILPCPQGSIFWSTPCIKIDYENFLTPPKLRRYWEIHSLRPQDFPWPSIKGRGKYLWRRGWIFQYLPHFGGARIQSFHRKPWSLAECLGLRGGTSSRMVRSWSWSTPSLESQGSGPSGSTRRFLVRRFAEGLDCAIKCKCCHSECQKKFIDKTYVRIHHPIE